MPLHGLPRYALRAVSRCDWQHIDVPGFVSRRTLPIY